MKPVALITIPAITILSIAGFSLRASAQDDFQPTEPHPIFYADQVAGVNAAAEPWSIIGQWHYARPDWRGMIDIRADGTFSRANNGETGKWKLAAEGDHFVLVLKWDHSAEETVALVSPTLFQGDTRKGEIIVRRLLPS